MFGRARARQKKAQAAPAEAEQPSLQLIAQKLERLVWRRLWGVDERQAWHVIQRMDEMYRQLYREQQIYYEALLQQERGTKPQVGNLPSLQPEHTAPASAPARAAVHRGATAGIPAQRVRMARAAAGQAQAQARQAAPQQPRSALRKVPKVARTAPPRHGRHRR